MLHISDALVDELVTAPQAQQVLQAAFAAFGQGRAAVQKRTRIDAGGVKLSTLGAVIPEQSISGAKVYTTIKGRFSFVILLFSAVDGHPLATLDATAITRIRTAACSVLMARKLARANAKVLGLFGTGMQGLEHAVQLAAAFRLERILLDQSRAGAAALAQVAAATGVETCAVLPSELAQESDIVVTATRSVTPLFDGKLLRPGAFVAAIGSSLPHTRELDDNVLVRSKAIVVEWREQVLEEAGDLVLAAPIAGVEAKLVELADVVNGRFPGRGSEDDIFVYKAVGIGLEDIAIAGLAYKLIQGDPS